MDASCSFKRVAHEAPEAHFKVFYSSSCPSTQWRSINFMSAFRLAARVMVRLRSRWLFFFFLTTSLNWWFEKSGALATINSCCQQLYCTSPLLSKWRDECWFQWKERSQLQASGYQRCLPPILQHSHSWQILDRCPSLMKSLPCICVCCIRFHVVGVCMYVRQVPGCSQVDRQLQQRAGIKRFSWRLAPIVLR